MKHVCRGFLLIALVAGGVLSPPQRAEAEFVFEFTAGVDDAFALPTEAATPSADLAALLGTTHAFDAIAGIDGAEVDRPVAHTFLNLPQQITAATLELRVRGGDSTNVADDGLVLSMVDLATPDLATGALWARTFGQTFNPPGPFSGADDGLAQVLPWSTGDEALLVLDLAALPLAGGGTLNLLDDLNLHRRLDVTVWNNTGVDFIRLTVVSPVPEPGTIGLAALGLSSVAVARGVRRLGRGGRSTGSTRSVGTELAGRQQERGARGASSPGIG